MIPLSWTVPLVLSIALVIFLWAALVLWPKFSITRLDTHHELRKIFGVVLLLVSITGFIHASHNPPLIFWFCYLSIPLITIGLFTRNAALLRSQLYILAIPDFIWSVDLFSHLLAGHTLFGITDYVFTPGITLAKIITLQHFIAVPIMIYALVVIKQDTQRSWIISLAHVTLVYILARLFTAPEDNINCAYTYCGTLHLPLTLPYPLIWFAFVIAMIFISRAFLSKLHASLVKVKR